jgi:acetate kinase
MTLTRGGSIEARNIETRDHADAFETTYKALDQIGLMDSIDAVGHRVVHGGLRFRTATRIEAGVIEAIREATDLAPLHNRPALAVIEAAQERLGANMPMVACFDTAFFAELPDVASRYAIPKEVSERYGIRRFGFHGLAHGDMVRRFQALRPDVPRPRLITLMLGGGCSATASFDGAPVDTSMGYTPLEGLVMGTRSGDIDPALPLRLQALSGQSAGEIEALLNEGSGLLGLSGRSGEMRDLAPAAASGDQEAAFAIELFCTSVRKYIGAYLAILGSADAIVFGGGIGENMPEVRARICQGFEWAGLQLDAQANGAPNLAEARISTAGSSIDAWVMRVDEAAVIARETAAVLTD